MVCSMVKKGLIGAALIQEAAWRKSAFDRSLFKGKRLARVDRVTLGTGFQSACTW